MMETSMRITVKCWCQKTHCMIHICIRECGFIWASKSWQCLRITHASCSHESVWDWQKVAINQILHDHTRVRISDRWIYQHPKHISSGVCNLRKLCLFNAKSQPKICKHWIATLEYSDTISIICRMWSNKTNSQINTVERSRRYNKLSHSHSEFGSYTLTNWMINAREYNWNRLRKNPNKTNER